MARAVASSFLVGEVSVAVVRALLLAAPGAGAPPTTAAV